ncbi:macro domain-containing protein [Streptomyces sp. NPDC058947]|uniref:macro domain-containing protein n=1 Tax=Streptomyces sp. NPDC058947 TaxID=3346675 RepID=UPI0036C59976
MPLRHTEGNLLNSTCQVLVNAVNCIGVTGAGIAKQFQDRWPEQVAEYREFCRAGKMQPGVIHEAVLPDGRVILSVPTKRHWRDRSLFSDVAKGIDAVVEWCDRVKPVSIAIPPLGCGLGGLPQRPVLNEINLKMADLPMEVWLYGFRPLNSEKAP